MHFSAAAAVVVVLVVVVVVACNAQHVLEECLAYPVTLLNSPPDESRHALTDKS